MPTYTGFTAYGGTPADYVPTVVTVAGISVLGAAASGSVQVYGQESGGSPLTNLKRDSDGATISSVPINAAGLVSRFHVPDGTTPFVPVLGGGRARLSPADGLRGAQGDPGASVTGPPGPGVPAGGVTGQVLAKTSDQENATAWVNPVAAPDALTGSNLATTATTTGTVTGIGLATAFNNSAAGTWGVRPTLYWNPSTTTWPARTVPTGYSGPVIWNSETDPSATTPPNGIDNDLWDKAS